MKTSSSSPPRDSVLIDLEEAEFELEQASKAIVDLMERIEHYEPKDPDKLDSLKLLGNMRLQHARDSTRVVMIKARYGIVGHSWYNSGTDTAEKS